MMKYLTLIAFGLLVFAVSAAIYVYFLMLPPEEPVYKLGVLQFADAPLPRAIIESALTELKREGFGEERLTIVYPESPASDKEKAKAVIDYLAKEKVDVILATNSIGGRLVSEKVKDVPVVFVAVAKPKTIGLIQDYVSSGSNLTGVEYTIPLGKILELINTAFPQIKTIGVLYSLNEPAPILTEELEDIASQFNLKIIKKETTAGEAESGVKYLAGAGADLIYLVPDPTLVPKIKAIKQTADKYRLPLAGNTIDAEYLLALNADTEEMGVAAAELIIKILNGNKPSVLSVYVPRNFVLTLNAEEAGNKGLIFPEWLLRIADKIITKEGMEETIRK